VERPEDRRSSEEREDDPNAIGYRNADEEAPYDERGSQGTGPAEPPPEEEPDPAA
jgi:hypothetical protein